jgi:molybdopterin-guanine dinucleotide biosynthesis protein A
MERDEQRDHDLAQRIGDVILAGGKSSRMGTDKALMPLAGKPLLAHVIARLAPQVSDLILSANGDLSRFHSFRLPVVPDSFGDYPGPLGGLLAWFEHRPTFVSPSPCRLTHHSFRQISLTSLAAKTSPPRPIIVRSVSGVHPVGLLPIEVSRSLGAVLDQDMREVGAWTKQQSAIEVAFPQTDIGGKKIDPSSHQPA